MSISFYPKLPYSGPYSGDGSGLTFPYFSAYQDGYTQLTAAITGPSTTTPIQVTSTAGFPSSGYIAIEEEIIGYTTTTPTTFDGTITRGALGTSAGKSAHAIGKYVTEAAAAPVGTSVPMRISVVTLSNGITCTTPDTKIYFTNAGIYNIQFSAQLLNYSTGDNVTIWIKQNGFDVADTAGDQYVPAKHASTPGAALPAWNYLLQMAAGDHIEFYWHSDTGETVLATYPPNSGTTHPSSPSLIVTATFVSAV